MQIKQIALDFLKRKPNVIDPSYYFHITAPDLHFIYGSSPEHQCLFSNKTINNFIAQV